MFHDDIGYPIGGVRIRPTRGQRDRSERQDAPIRLRLKTCQGDSADVHGASVCRRLGIRLDEHLFGLFVLFTVLPALLLGLVFAFPYLLIRYGIIAMKRCLRP